MNTLAVKCLEVHLVYGVLAGNFPVATISMHVDMPSPPTSLLLKNSQAQFFARKFANLPHAQTCIVLSLTHDECPKLTYWWRQAKLDDLVFINVFKPTTTHLN